MTLLNLGLKTYNVCALRTYCHCSVSSGSQQEFPRYYSLPCKIWAMLYQHLIHPEVTSVLFPSWHQHVGSKYKKASVLKCIDLFRSVVQSLLVIIRLLIEFPCPKKIKVNKLKGKMTAVKVIILYNSPDFTFSFLLKDIALAILFSHLDSNDLLLSTVLFPSHTDLLLFIPWKAFTLCHFPASYSIRLFFEKGTYCCLFPLILS